MSPRPSPGLTVGDVSGELLTASPLTASPSPSPVGGSSPGLPAPAPPTAALPSSPTLPLKRKLSRNSRPPETSYEMASPSLASPSRSHCFPPSPTGSPLRTTDRLPLFVADEAAAAASPRARFAEHLPSTNLARHSSGGASHYASLSGERDENGVPRRLRRWSTVGRSRRATAQWASPYLQAGLEELKSIFDVDSHPIPSGGYDEADAICQCRRGPLQPRTDNAGDKLGAPWSPHTSCPGESCPARMPGAAPRSDNDAQPDAPPSPSSDARPPLKRGAWSEGPQKENKDRLVRKHALIATGLVGVGLGMVLVCTVGTMYYSDVFSLALLACLGLQPFFAAVGIAGIASKRRALMDMSSRALRAHVLAQCLVAIVAFLDLSASSTRARAASPSSPAPLRFFRGMAREFGAESSASTYGSAQEHAHDTQVGSLSSRTYHLVSFGAQVAVPVLVALWVQYAVALGLAGLARARTRQARSYQWEKAGRDSSRGAGVSSDASIEDCDGLLLHAHGHASRESSASSTRPTRSTSLHGGMTSSPSWNEQDLPSVSRSKAGKGTPAPARGSSRMRRAPHSQSGAGRMSGHARSFSTPVVPPTAMPPHIVPPLPPLHLLDAHTAHRTEGEERTSAAP